MKLAFILLVPLSFAPTYVVAKCANKQSFHCVEFSKIESFNEKHSKCSGLVDIKMGSERKKLSMVFRDKASCSSRTTFVGHLLPLCQDETVWTKAEYEFRPSSRQKCSVNHKQKLKFVKANVERIVVGMTRKDVEKWFNEIDNWDLKKSTTSYYEHPNIIIEIPFDQTGGFLSRKNIVTGEPTIYEKPASLRSLNMMSTE